MRYTAFRTHEQLRLIMWFVLFAFFIIVARLFYLQIYSSHQLYQLSQRNCLRFEKVIPPRGNILDCNGALMATNRPIINVVWQGSGKKTFDGEQLAAIATLSTFLEQPINTDDLLDFERYGQRTILVNDISFEQLSKIIEFFPHNKNLIIATDFKRFYPFGASASHLLGYLSGITYDPTGRMGIEKTYNETLSGVAGEVATTINSIGKHLKREEIQQALNGENIKTTIDMQLQTAAESCFPQNHVGALIVMEAQTGAIRVLLSQPSFDPNIFITALSPEIWKKLQEKNPFINRALSASYPPASLFKLVTLITALETHAITPQSTWFCSGSMDFGRRTYHCKNRDGHGLLALQDAVAKSCNVAFYEISRRLKIDNIAHFATMLGLGIKSNIGLPEIAGLVPTSAWKKATFRKPWYPGETLSIGIGQGYLQVTPIQIARMVGAIIEGNLVKPRILENEPCEQKSITISQATLNFVKTSMKKVVEYGSGQSLHGLKNIKIYAKTGTAQVQALDEHNLTPNKAHLEHGWIAAHITYKNFQPIVLVVLEEHVGSSKFSVDTANQFLKAYCHIMDSQSQHEIAQEQPTSSD